MNFNISYSLAWITATTLIWCVGCGSNIERTNVVGRVTLDGQLVDGAVVVFNPTSCDGISVWSVVK
ncbi:MAG: hypothetical protein O2955_16480 [Planctomycetota bacterium]|nr:hypothetical protein [Planctomycetota bacterium]MDA1214110.1 hypothetical protein [Planctomycetota bacterium]